MDEMRINLKSNFMRKMVSKVISRMIFKKTGYKVDIQLDEIDFWSIDGDTTVRVNVEAKLNSNEFKKIMKTVEEGLG